MLFAVSRGREAVNDRRPKFRESQIQGTRFNFDHVLIPARERGPAGNELVEGEGIRGTGGNGDFFHRGWRSKKLDWRRGNVTIIFDINFIPVPRPPVHLSRSRCPRSERESGGIRGNSTETEHDWRHIYTYIYICMYIYIYILLKKYERTIAYHVHIAC